VRFPCVKGANDRTARETAFVQPAVMAQGLFRGCALEIVEIFIAFLALPTIVTDF
jgi:hypothetical protein